MDITKVYFQQCKPLCVPLGFRRIRQTFARIINDVLQTFTFKRYSSGYECTVEFGVFPLSQGILYPDLGLYDLCNFEMPTYPPRWSYDRNSEESINVCVQHICGCIDRNLLPLFAEADCSAKALPALITLDSHFFNIQKNWLEQRGEDHSKSEWRYGSLLRTEKFFMALKCGEYNYAKEAAQVQLPHMRPEWQELCHSILNQLAVGNTSYVDKILYEREQESLKNLEKYRLIPITSINAD